MASLPEPTDASITVVAWSGLDLAALLGDDYVIGRARRVSGQTSTLDTSDHRLARTGVMVSVADGTWSVRCGAYGPHVFVGDDPAPPADLLAALSGVARGAALELAVRVRRAGRAFPVRAASSDDNAGEDSDIVGRVVDEDVSVLDGRRVVSRQRYIVVEGPPEFVAQVRRRLGAHGMQDRAVDSIENRVPLGPPDPIPWPLDERPDAATIIQRALARSVARLLAHDPVVRLDLHVEGVHQMRVATRRLRSDLKTFGTLMGPLPEGLVDDLGWIAQTLGEVRDPDVLRQGLIEAIEHLDPADRRTTNSLVKRLVRERDVALGRLHAALESPRYDELVRRLVELAESPPLADAAGERAASVLRPSAQQAWGRVQKAARRAGKPGATVDDVHALRIRAKRFRYALDALADVEPAAKAHAERLADLQDVLGEFNDAAVAEGWLREAAAHEDDPRRMFVLGQLVMTQRLLAETRRREWPTAWKPVRRRRRSRWLER